MIARVRPLFGSSTSRDLVFIDQRGTGASHLTCPAFPGLDNKVVLRASVESCLQHLNADLGSYTTAMSVDDVNEVLAALHYNHVNLVGISYGTTAEQMFVLRHPARVRTMTLLSGTLLTIPVFERFPQNAQLALNNIVAECAGEPSCHEAFPDLTADWTALWTSVTTQPWVVPASRSPDGKQAVFTADWVARSLHQAMTVATTHSEIPLLIHILGSTTDHVTAILSIAKAMPQDETQTTSGTNMLGYSTRCNEPWARYDPKRLVGADSFEYASDLADARWWQYVCALIPPASPPADAPTSYPSPRCQSLPSTARKTHRIRRRTWRPLARCGPTAWNSQYPDRATTSTTDRERARPRSSSHSSNTAVPSTWTRPVYLRLGRRPSRSASRRLPAADRTPYPPRPAYGVTAPIRRSPAALGGPPPGAQPATPPRELPPG